MEVIVLLAAGLLALAIISIKIRRLIKIRGNVESGAAGFVTAALFLPARRIILAITIKKRAVSVRFIAGIIRKN